MPFSGWVVTLICGKSCGRQRIQYGDAPLPPTETTIAWSSATVTGTVCDCAAGDRTGATTDAVAPGEAARVTDRALSPAAHRT